MHFDRRLIIFAIILAGGCGDDGDSRSAEAPPLATLPGVYSGTFPCDGCPGIPTRVWLRSDGRYFLTQNYPADDERDAMDAHSLGRWLDQQGLIELRGRGPMRVFSRPDRDTLIMQAHSDLEHRLIRDSVQPSFASAIRMEGLMRLNKDGGSFEECLTGYNVPVRRGAEFSRFGHQYRSVGTQGQAAYVELDGRFVWSADGNPASLIVERFITVREKGGCQ